MSMNIDMAELLAPKMPIPTNYNLEKHFIVIGAGGTGGYLIPNLVRQLSLQNAIRKVEGLRPHKITIVDADDIEPKNLTRQQFVAADVGRNKAEVMSTRYGRAFNMPIEFVPEYIVDVDMLLGLVARNHVPVYVDCVDNNKTRAIMFDAYSRHNGYMISSGNEEFSGQVVFSMSSGSREATTISEIFNGRGVLKHIRNHSTSPEANEFWRTPTLVDMFPTVLDGTDRLPTEMSCAEAAESAPQNIMTNMVAANIMFGFVNKLLMKHEDKQGIEQYAVFFNTKDFNQRVLSTSEIGFSKGLDMSGENPRKALFFGSPKTKLEEYRSVLKEKPTGVTA